MVMDNAKPRSARSARFTLMSEPIVSYPTDADASAELVNELLDEAEEPDSGHSSRS
jgi:hypothetical protein